jgi:hypothetical protein
MSVSYNYDQLSAGLQGPLLCLTAIRQNAMMIKVWARSSRVYEFMVDEERLYATYRLQILYYHLNRRTRAATGNG